MRHLLALPAVSAACCLCAPPALAADNSANTLPISEVTAFKDGHALVLRTGKTPLNTEGDAVLTELPRPVLGTFWADAHGGGTLASVRVERAEAEITKETSTINGLLHANVGRRIAFTTNRMTERTTGRIIAMLDADEQQPAQTQPRMMYDNWGRLVPVQATGPRDQAEPIALIAEDGLSPEDSTTHAVRLGEFTSLAFLGETPATTYTADAEREQMTLDLVWPNNPPGSADVSIMYLQRGLRWIPSYKITILSGGKVEVELQATLINELADLENVTVHMAIGVPSFAFDHTPDPMALRESMDQLGLFFQRPATTSGTAGMFSNAIMSQSARMTEFRSHAQAGPQAGNPAAPTAMTGGDQTEDLFVYTVENITLARGARMVVPITRFEASAQTVYRLDLPAAPPANALQSLNNDQQRQLFRLLNRPVASHVLRITNDHPAGHPITTAPALIVKDGRTLAQGLITYTSGGAKVDLEVGKAVDIAVSVSEVEMNRSQRAREWNGRQFQHVALAYSASLTNRKTEPVSVEVRKMAYGVPEEVGQNGDATTLSVFSAENEFEGFELAWWRWYHWPSYWHALNGAVRFEWDVKIEPGETAELDASWHYYWR